MGAHQRVPAHRQERKGGTIPTLREAACPECDAVVQVVMPLECGQQLSCRSCRSTLQIRRLQPLTLDWAFVEPIRDPDETE
jgi:uncharacterized paraquat-inducible protein A